MADRNDGRSVRGETLIAGAIVIAALILGWGSSGSQPRFQIAGTSSGVVRLDTDSGAMLACDMQTCRQIQTPMRERTWGPMKLVIGSGDPTQRQQQKQPEQPKQLPPPRQ